MKRAHIAVISYPQYPHVGPVLPIIAVLVRRGYRVTCATSTQFSSRVQALGAEVIPCRGVPTLLQAGGEENTAVQLIGGMLEDISGFYAAERPALILYDYAALAGQILARRWEIPAIKTSPIFAYDRKVYASQMKDRLFRQAVLNYGRDIDCVLAGFGVRGNDWVFHREALNIHLCPKELQPCAYALDESCFFAGRCAGEQPYFGTWNRGVYGDRPVALVTTSTHYVRGPEYFAMCIDALAPLRWNVILSIGISFDPAVLGALPPHFEVVRETSHIRMLPVVDVQVCLGGVMTCSESMYHGVPLVITSYGFPEIEWQAENVEELGFGIHLRKSETNSESVRRAAVRAIEDPVIRERVKEIQCRVRREPGAEDAANCIEGYLNSRRGN